jgi:hypothetical protein
MFLQWFQELILLFKILNKNVPYKNMNVRKL